MTLLEKQIAFSWALSKLIQEAFLMNYQVTMGQVLRTQEEADENAAKGTGIKNSVHKIKLAADLCLFKNGEYLTKTEDYEALGVWWESLSTPECEYCWGGRFKDGNHFSIEHGGVR